MSPTATAAPDAPAVSLAWCPVCLGEGLVTSLWASPVMCARCKGAGCVVVVAEDEDVSNSNESMEAAK